MGMLKTKVNLTDSENSQNFTSSQNFSTPSSDFNATSPSFNATNSTQKFNNIKENSVSSYKNYCIFEKVISVGSNYSSGGGGSSPEWQWICKPDVIALIVLMIVSWIISVVIMIESTYDLFHRKTSTVTP